MARFGSPFSAGFGTPQNHIAELSVMSRNGGASLGVSFIPTANYGNAWFGIYVNAVNKQFVYAAEGQWTSETKVPTNGTGNQSVTVVRIGHASSYDMSRIVKALEAPSVDKVTLGWDWNTDIIQPAMLSTGIEDTVLTNFVLTGVNIDNLVPTESVTRRYLNIDVTVTAGNALVELIIGGSVVASGTVAVPGTCTLAEAGTSGISGTVDVGASAATVADMKLYFRRPYYVIIKRDQVDPPTTVIANVPYQGRATDKWTEPTALTAGTYYYRIQSVSDTGVAGNETATLTAVVPGPPAAPTALAYASGDASGTVLSFTGSATAGATYRLYLRKISDLFFDLKNIAATAVAGSTNITMPAITGYPGTVQALVRAVNGSVEEQGLDYITLDYDAAGVRTSPKPNTPIMGTADITNGRTVTFLGMYDPTDELGTGSMLQLFSRTPAGAYDFTTPDAVFTLVDSPKEPLKQATITHTYATNGYLYLTIKAVTALSALSDSYASEQLVYITDQTQSAPSTATVSISRG